MGRTYTKSSFYLGKTIIITIWSHRNIKVGEDWNKIIFDNIKNSDMAIILISKDFLDFEFILSYQLPRLFSAKEGASIR